LKNTPKTAISIIKRYLKLNPDFAENFVDYLIQVEEYNDATLYIARVLLIS